jgi:hypothetical protein|tara:strand:- start:2084 stop:2881 length:798 start_codon:yes stop_codon:yes gene_type:complete
MSSGSGSDSGGGGNQQAAAKAAMTSNIAYSGGRTDAQSQYGGGSYDSSKNVSSRQQEYGGGGGVDNKVDPGFQEALRKQAIRQADPVYGDPDPEVDVDPRDRDSVTSFFDNYIANIKSNPLNIGVIGALRTLYQTEQAKNMLLDTPGYEFLNDYSISDNTQINDSETRGVINNIVSQLPYNITGTTPQESMVNKYFDNLNTSGLGLSSDLQTDYNNAKTKIDSILGIIPPSQQFGYSAQPYGLLSSTNTADNPFNIDYLKQRGLI